MVLGCKVRVTPLLDLREEHRCVGKLKQVREDAVSLNAIHHYLLVSGAYVCNPTGYPGYPAGGSPVRNASSDGKEFMSATCQDSSSKIIINRQKTRKRKKG
jgi:hypothetical protein